MNCRFFLDQAETVKVTYLKNDYPQSVKGQAALEDALGFAPQTSTSTTAASDKKHDEL
jgi:hypothetical protein